MNEEKRLNLVVVAHPDDEVLGFGATGAKLVRAGERVRAVILCGSVDVRTHRPSDEQLFTDIRAANELLGFDEPILGSFPNIRMNNVDHIALVQFIEHQISTYQPARIFTHHPGDLNDDHVHVAKACMAAARLFQRRNDVLPLESLHLMEILSSTDWAFSTSTQAFQPNTFIGIESTLELKIQALGMYRNVMREFPHPRSIEVIRGHAAYRGGQCGEKFAEGFETVFRKLV